MDKAKFLLVDDIEDNLAALSALLDRADLELYRAHSGAEALELLLQHDFALAILDVQMPEMDGFELAELMRGAEKSKHVPIIFVTAGTREPKRIFKGYEAGAIDFLFKPIDPVILQHKANVFIDLYQQKQERERLLASERAARTAAEQATRVRDEVLAIVSHDLRNPLSSIMISARLLNRIDNPDVQRHSTRLLRASQRMNHMIEDLLDLAYIEGGQLKLVRRAHDALELVRDCAEMMRPLALQKQLEILTDVSGPPVMVDGDRERVFQVFSNLIGNAIKFTPDKGTITLKARPEGDEVVFSVIDSGPGVDAEAAPHVFDRFWQGHRLPQGGIGLGLTITKGIVEAHGGRIWLNPGTGQGASFSFTLPRAAPVKVQPRGEVADRHCTVMVVDDDPDVRSSLSELLADNGYDVIAVAGSGEALERLEGGADPKLILLDLFMPGMSGDQFRAQLKQNPRFSHIATVIITGNGRFGRDLKLSGNDPVLAKPIEPNVLLRTAESYCR